MSKVTLVLGAGIIGVSVAIHLARRGRTVVLVDRRSAGEETSFGNAGLIQREGVVPYSFPQNLGLLLRYALNNRIDAHYHGRAMIKLAPFLARYWWHSNSSRHKAIALAYAPLIEHSISEHQDLINAAGAAHLIRKDGWMQIFRTTARRDAELKEAERLAQNYGLGYHAMTAEELAVVEPHLRGAFTGALKWKDPWSVTDPHQLTLAYLAHFHALGGQSVRADASSLAPGPSGRGWSLRGADGPISGDDVVLALGPWSQDIAAQLGYRFPFGVKRGYHMHYATSGNAVLNNWTMDAERGYFLAPMKQGIRLTTGAEFADRDAPKSPVQLTRAEAVAREIFPLAERLDQEPWMGARPCTPDMMPVIGRAPRHENLWFAFGHALHGLTLGPVTGRLIAEMITGQTPFLNPAAWSPNRFKP